MRRFTRGLRPFLCIAQSALLMLGMPAVAANTYSSESSRTAAYEQILFGTARTSLSLEARLEAIESNLFGKPRKGSTEARLDAIGKLLGDQKKSLLLPPIAPQLERPDSAPVAEDYGGASPYDSGDSPALSQARPAAAGSGDKVKGLLRQAVQEYSQGNTVAAEKTFRRVLAIEPNNGDANFNLGAIAEGKGDMDAALGFYKKARSANPGDQEIQQAVATLEQQARDKRESTARARADQAAQAQAQAQKQQRKSELKKLADDAAGAYRNRNYDAAIRNLDIVAREAPNDAEVQYALAQAWRGKSDYGRARRHLQTAMSLEPGNPLYRTALSEVDNEERNSQVANAPQDDTPAGQITPFEGVDTTSRYGRSYPDSRGGGISDVVSRLFPGAGSGGMDPYAGYGSMNTYDGYGYSRGGSLAGTRLKRAAIGGLAGAAIGAFMGRGTEGGARSGAMRGAIYGGMAGLLFGGY